MAAIVQRVAQEPKTVVAVFGVLPIAATFLSFILLFYRISRTIREQRKRKPISDPAPGHVQERGVLLNSDRGDNREREQNVKNRSSEHELRNGASRSNGRENGTGGRDNEDGDSEETVIGAGAGTNSSKNGGGLGVGPGFGSGVVGWRRRRIIALSRLVLGGGIVGVGVARLVMIKEDSWRVVADSGILASGVSACHYCIARRVGS